MVLPSHPQEMFVRMGFFLLEEKELEIWRISFLIKKRLKPFLSKGSIWFIIVDISGIFLRPCEKAVSLKDTEYLKRVF